MLVQYLSRSALKDASFTSPQQIHEAIDDFVKVYNKKVAPFEWEKRNVYKSNAPERTSVGKGHVLSGVVRSSTDCSPIEGAQIEFWLAGPNGKYDDDHRATMFSDKIDAYKFESNFPPPYSGRPSHIHIKVTAKGYRTLVAQYYPEKGQTEGLFDLILIPE